MICVKKVWPAKNPTYWIDSGHPGRMLWPRNSDADTLVYSQNISGRKNWPLYDLWHIPTSLHCTYPDFNLTLFTCKHFILWSEIFSLAGRLNLVLIWILTEGGAIQSRKKGMDFWYPIRLLHYEPIGWRIGQIFYHLSNFDQFSKHVTIINLVISVRRDAMA